ncbi:MAG: L,D-transpeptidase [Hyphomicrobiales bacterium]|nr:L,D-transpeptidase [Hyphomicrobiales bacterium]
MKTLGIIIAFFAMVVVAPAFAAKVEARIDISSQRMYVKVNGVKKYSWAVSTGRSGYSTPTGTFRPQRLERSWYSRKYDNAPMPHSVFFYGGYAIHGTTAVRNLGRRASHGCVRLHPSNAARLYSLIRKYGMGNSRVIVTH